MTVWITGAAGMLGREVVERCASNGVAHIGTTRSQVDVASPAALTDAFERLRPSAIVHCAAYTQVDLCESRRDEAHAANSLGPGRLAELCRARAVPFLLVSTDYIFDGSASVPYDESMPASPTSVYGATKREGEERVLHAMAGSDVPHWIVRTSWVFAAHGRNFVRTMLGLMQSKSELRVVNDQRGRPTHAGDLAQALIDLSGIAGVRPPAPSGIYHFANEGHVSWWGLAHAVLALAREFHAPIATQIIHPIATHEYPTPARRPAWSVLATEKVTQALGHPPRHFEQPLAHVVRTLLDKG